MVAVDLHIDPTLEAADRAMEDAQDTRPRPYLGASSIGDPCARKLWYRFRWASETIFSASTLRRFEDGFHGEDVQAARLSLVEGIELSTHGPDKRQWGMEDHERHFRGHCDGFILGLLQAPKTPHIWEHKQVNEAKFKKLDKLKREKGEKEALAHWDEVYYAQAQVYMHKWELTRHYLTCSTPGGRETTSVRTNYDRGHAEAFLQKAKDIIVSDTPPGKLSEQRTHFQCKYCDFYAICHEPVPLSVNCRTCRHSFPDRAGAWTCNKHGGLNIEQQRLGCADHEVIAA